MPFPIFEVPGLGGGMFVGTIAIIHVIIAHLAIGAGLFLAVTHTSAIRRGDALMLDFLYRYGRFLILLAFVSGAVTGVAIWVTISLVSPRATSALIHLFVWAWAIEWVFFLVEITAGYIYFYGWHRLTPRRQATVAWIYFVAAYLSLAVINGIVTFMLTPGRWQPPSGPSDEAARAFWSAFFNPTYWPSLALRTVSALALAGISVAVVANAVPGYSRDQRGAIVRAGRFLLLPIGLMAPLAVWYFSAVPEAARRLAFGGSVAMTLFFASGVVSSIYLALHTYGGLFRHQGGINLRTSVLLGAIACVATASMEFVREGIRKPYLITGYMYSNQILADPGTRRLLDRDGILRHARFAYPPHMTLEEVYRLPPHELGRYVFNAQCRACHEPGGTNDIKPLINDASRELLTKMTGELDRLKGFMPPFVGNDRERQAVVEYQLFLARGDAYRPPENDGESLSAGGPAPLARSEPQELRP